jgi:hypothetical protein
VVDYKRTRNLCACQLLLAHRKLESTVRYFGIEVVDALALLEPDGDLTQGARKLPARTAAKDQRPVAQSVRQLPDGAGGASIAPYIGPLARDSPPSPKWTGRLVGFNLRGLFTQVRRAVDGGRSH